MLCPICGSETVVTHSYSAGSAGRAVQRRCQGPKRHRLTYAVQLVGEMNGRGSGAWAVATRMKNGENPVEQHDESKEDDS